MVSAIRNTFHTNSLRTTYHFRFLKSHILNDLLLIDSVKMFLEQ